MSRPPPPPRRNQQPRQRNQFPPRGQNQQPRVLPPQQSRQRYPRPNVQPRQYSAQARIQPPQPPRNIQRQQQNNRQMNQNQYNSQETVTVTKKVYKSEPQAQHNFSLGGLKNLFGFGKPKVTISSKKNYNQQQQRPIQSSNKYGRGNVPVNYKLVETKSTTYNRPVSTKKTLVSYQKSSFSQKRDVKQGRSTIQSKKPLLNFNTKQLFGGGKSTVVNYSKPPPPRQQFNNNASFNNRQRNRGNGNSPPRRVEDLSNLKHIDEDTKQGHYTGTVILQPMGDNQVLQMFHGKGKYVSKNGTTYEGDFYENRKEGRGKYSYKAGTVYEGEFKADQPHGQGTFTYKDGSKYVGMVKDSKYEGKGKLFYSNGSLKYDGFFTNQQQHGKGVYIYQNGNKYVGSFLHGKRHGKGELEFSSGSKYIGEFINDKQEGLGVLLFGNGQEWIGYFKNNQKDKEYIQVLLHKLKLDKYYNECLQKGFSISMMKTMDTEDFEILLEIIFTKEEDRKKVADALKKEYEFVIKMCAPVKVE